MLKDNGPPLRVSARETGIERAAVVFQLIAVKLTETCEHLCELSSIDTTPSLHIMYWPEFGGAQLWRSRRSKICERKSLHYVQILAF